MKIFSWMRSKRNGNEGSNTSNPQPKSYQSCEEELSDWANGLLAIGTFGNNNLKHCDQPDNTSAQDLEEVDRELRLLLNSKHISVEQLLECLAQRSRGITKKSLSFLIKKALLCGAAPPPIPDPKSDLSTMDKIFRAMLHKKIYPQRPTPNKYLDMAEDQGNEEDNHRSKWVKTDSEYIVLEI